MFVHGCIYIYKQGFTIRGNRDSWYDSGRKGPLPIAKALDHTEQLHPVCFAALLTPNWPGAARVPPSEA